MHQRLPPLPRSSVKVIEDYSDRSRCDEGFIRLRRQRLALRYEDGSESETFAYDEVDRNALDAVVIVPHFKNGGDEHWVFLRSALRPPVALRSRERSPIQERSTLGHIWEVPAGLVEADEQTVQGLRACAARELAEEVGIHLSPEHMQPLGPPMFPAPALIGERHFYFHCEVDPSTRLTPQGDGSALENHATIVAVPLSDALELVRNGEIEDAKTEVALRRLAELLA